MATISGVKIFSTALQSTNKSSSTSLSCRGRIGSPTSIGLATPCTWQITMFTFVLKCRQVSECSFKPSKKGTSNLMCKNHTASFINVYPGQVFISKQKNQVYFLNKSNKWVFQKMGSNFYTIAIKSLRRMSKKLKRSFKSCTIRKRYPKMS